GWDGPHGKLCVLAPGGARLVKEVFYAPGDPPLAVRVAAGEVYVTSASGVRVYDLECVKLREWGGTVGKAPGEFSFPNGIARLSGGALVVTDGNNKRIKFYSAEGSLTSVIGTPPTGIFDRSKAAFDLPSGVAVDDRDVIVVADAFANALRVLAPNGRQVGMVGDPAVANGDFLRPGGVWHEGGTSWLVADEMNGRVVRVRIRVPARLVRAAEREAPAVPGARTSRTSAWWACCPLALVAALVVLVAIVALRLRRRAAGAAAVASPAEADPALTGEPAEDAGHEPPDNLT
ncbi:MAG: hypothetical protein FDZ70_09590, partial [Actinobacteria bacterium]